MFLNQIWIYNHHKQKHKRQIKWNGTFNPKIKNQYSQVIKRLRTLLETAWFIHHSKTDLFQEVTKMYFLEVIQDKFQTKNPLRTWNLDKFSLKAETVSTPCRIITKTKQDQ